MPKQTSFSILYKRLLDCNFSPDPARSAETLEAVLRRLSAAGLPKNPDITIEIHRLL